jgi:hypothetical protein
MAFKFGKDYDDMTEEERRERAEKVFVGSVFGMLIQDPQTGEWINLVEYARRYPTTEIDYLMDDRNNMDHPGFDDEE